MCLHHKVNCRLEAPQNPPAFFEAVAASEVYELPTYPTKECEEFCDEDNAVSKMESVLPNVMKCSYTQDAVYESRLRQFNDKKVPLELAFRHLGILEPSLRVRSGEAWEFCLRMDAQQCEELNQQYLRVLDIILENLLDVTNELDLPAFAYFDTLLGAWRDEGIIPHTRDVDVILPSTTDWKRITAAMWNRGFYVFEGCIYRACFASYHTLAPLLHSRDVFFWTVLTVEYHTMIFLYTWEEKNSRIVIQTANASIPKHYIFPLNYHERIFTMPIPSIVYPEAMFRTEYGLMYSIDPDLKLSECESYCGYACASMVRPSYNGKHINGDKCRLR
ncbi:hypothetical protein THRCLA_02883 [Thraustotheca clavata]|uniref:Uncharacterized protein n=1 Tax=Thraustotheca clavata TaxID=74557 RepID=A0A1W0A3U1_9STRA|nr:hypothetical protein THRCLA_02883 [Thraustotheca clavata]